jgi:hypothetical protein
LRSFGAINRLISGVNAIVIGATPFLVDLGHGANGSYLPGVAVAAGALVVCAGLTFGLPPLPQPPGRVSPAR